MTPLWKLFRKLERRRSASSGLCCLLPPLSPLGATQPRQQFLFTPQPQPQPQGKVHVPTYDQPLPSFLQALVGSKVSLCYPNSSTEVKKTTSLASRLWGRLQDWPFRITINLAL